MESEQGRRTVGGGAKQHARRRSRRRWVMVLALLGFGAGVLAPAAGIAGDVGEWRHGFGVPVPDRRRASQHQVRSSAESEARMQPGSGLAAGGADVSEEGQEGMEAIPMPVMDLLYSLRVAHHACECESDRRLCALITAHHARTGIGLVAWKRTAATQSVVSEAESPGMQDAIAASYAVTPVKGRTVRTRRPDKS